MANVHNNPPILALSSKSTPIPEGATPKGCSPKANCQIDTVLVAVDELFLKVQIYKMNNQR